MSLYDHIANKADLFSSMGEKVIEEVIVPPPFPEHWRDALTAIARRQYSMFIRHPWLVVIRGQTPRFGPNATMMARQSAQAMENVELRTADESLVQGTLNDYVLGYSLRAIEAPRPEDLEDLIPEGDLNEFSEIASLPESLRTRSSMKRFEEGLQAVLDGVEHRFIERGG